MLLHHIRVKNPNEEYCMYLAYSMLVHQSIDKARNGLGCIY